jgi:hypothetical protein
MMRLLPACATAAFFALPFVATAQVPARPGSDTLYMSTSVGAFKILPGGSDTTRGTLDVEFEGTMMVSGLAGSVTPGAGVKMEYQRKDHNRKVFFGKGHIRVAGDFRAIQFFGRNLKGTYKGVGIARLYGEFDKKMETGYYWYASDPSTKTDWGSYGRTVVVPAPVNTAANPIKGKVKDVPKQGGGF